MSQDIYKPNHKLNLKLQNRDGSVVDYSVVINAKENEEEKKLFNVFASKEVIAKIKESKLNFLAKNSSIKGFRPGKAPLNLLWKQHEAELVNEILDNVINNTTQDIINIIDKDLVIAPKVDVKDFDFDKGLEFEVSLNLMPEFELPDASKISINTPKFTVTEADVNDRIEDLMKENKSFNKADAKHAAQDGDKLIIDFEGKVDGVAFEGGSANNFALVLGSKSFIDTFEEQLLKSKVGDQILVNVTFPENYHVKNLAGKPAEFAVKVHEIHTSSSLKNEEELVTLTGYKTKEDLRDRVKQAIEKACNERSMVTIKTNLFDQLNSIIKFKLPAILVDEEFANVWKNVEVMLKNGEIENKSEEELKDEYMKLAERRVKLGIALTRMAKEYNVSVEQQDIIEAVRAQAMANPSAAQFIIEHYTKNPKAVDALKGPILEDKVVKHLLTKIQKVEQPIEVKELLAPLA